MPARTPLRLGAALIAASLVLAPAPALALQSAGGGTAEAHADKTADIDFPGGTVAEYIETLRRAFDGEPRNVLMDEETAVIELDSAKMRAMTLSGALQLMTDIGPRSATSRQIRIESRSGYRTIGSWSHMVSVPGNHTQVYSIRSLIASSLNEDPAMLKVEDILTAVELIVTTSSPSAEPEISFHPETGLLIVAAPQHSLKAIGEAINFMTRDAATLREQATTGLHTGSRQAEAIMQSDAVDPELRLIELKGFLQTAELKLEQAELHIEQAEHEHNQMEAFFERKAVGSDQVSKTGFELRNRQLEARMAAAEVERIRRLVEHTEKAADPRARRSEISRLQQDIAEMTGELARLKIEANAPGVDADKRGRFAQQITLLELRINETRSDLEVLTRRPRRD